MRHQFLTLLLGLSFIPLASAQERDEGKPRRLCAPLSLLEIGGIKLSDSAKDMRRKLGPPQRVMKGFSEDDGGQYEVTSYIYKHLQVDFGRSSIERMSTVSPNASIPRGVRVGMTEAQVAERVGFYPEIDAGTYKVRLGPCRVEGLEELTLTFHRSEAPAQAESRLVQAEVTNFGP